MKTKLCQGNYCQGNIFWNYLWLLLIGVLMAGLPRGARGTDAYFPLASWGLNPATNRVVLITPEPGLLAWSSNGIPLYDRWKTNTGADGSFTITNMWSGSYRVRVQAPPSETEFLVYIPETNGLVNSAGLQAVPIDDTGSAARAWPIAISDMRYASLAQLEAVRTNAAAALGYVAQPASGALTNWSETDPAAYSNALASGYAAADLVAGSGSTNFVVATSNALRETISSVAGSAGVVSFNSRTGLVTLGAADVTNALGLVPASVGDVLAASNALRVTLIPGTNVTIVTDGTAFTISAAGSGNGTTALRLVEPASVGGSNTFEPVYSHAQSTNLYIYGITNHAADGVYSLKTNWTAGSYENVLWTNANLDVIWRWNDDLDTVYTFTNSAGQTNFASGQVTPSFGGDTVVLSGGLCGLARWNWTTNFTFLGFGVNGQSPTDGAVLAWGTGLDYTTNGGVWTVYATNIHPLSLAATNPPAAGKVLSVDSDTNLYWATVSGSGGTVGTNVLQASERITVFSTNLWLVAGTTNDTGLVLSNGYAGSSYTLYGGSLYSLILSLDDGANWVAAFETNVPVRLGFKLELAFGLGTPSGFSNFVVWTWSDTELFHKANLVYGQYLLADRPRYDSQVATRAWTISAANTAAERRTNWASIPAQAEVDLDGHPVRLSADWEQRVTEGATADVFSLKYLGSNWWTFIAAPPISAPVDYSTVVYDAPAPRTSAAPYEVGWDIPQATNVVYAPSNVLVCLPLGWTSAVPKIVWSQKSVRAAKWQEVPSVSTWPGTGSFVMTRTNWNFVEDNGAVYPSPDAIVGYTFYTNTGVLVSFAMPSVAEGYFKVVTNTGTPIVASLNGVLQLQPRTVAATNATTWGRGAGLLCVDGTELVLSVGTNAWKRLGTQTPWNTNVDAGGFSLVNADRIIASNGYAIRPAEAKLLSDDSGDVTILDWNLKTLYGGWSFEQAPSGSGSSLTNLNASALASGTVPLSRLPGTVITTVNTNWVDYPLSCGNSGGGHITLVEMASQAGGWIPNAYSVYCARFAAGASGTINWSIPPGQLAAGTNVQIEAGIITSNAFDVALFARLSTLTQTTPPVGAYVGSSTYTNTSPAGTSCWVFRTNFTIPTNCIGSIAFGTGGNVHMFYVSHFRMRIY